MFWAESNTFTMFQGRRGRARGDGMMEGELWLSFVPTVTVRGDVGLAFQLPSEAPRRKQWIPQGQRQDQEEKGKAEPRDGGSFFLAPATCGPP